VETDTGDTLGDFVRHIAPSIPAEDREDIVQDTWERALTNTGSAPHDSAGIGRWRRAIARNLVRDRWRRAHVPSPFVAPADAPPAEEQLVSVLEGEVVRSAFAALPPLWQQILFLRVVEHRPAAEVAELLQRNPAAIRQIQHRALSRLRRELTTAGWIEEAGGRR
jgi:RNA polymerase sigma-70 factor (ECF subfamily)